MVAEKANKAKIEHRQSREPPISNIFELFSQRTKRTANETSELPEWMLVRAQEPL